MPGASLHPLIADLRRFLAEDSVLSDPYSLSVYSYDGGTDAAAGDLVVIPSSIAELERIVEVAARHSVSIIPRGGGTGLSGAAIPCEGGITISFARLNHLLSIDAANLCATVEPGVINAALSRSAAANGLLFAPDPSSQTASTIGGNLAMNAGGPHTLAYGVTANHILGLTLLLPEGGAVTLGGTAPDAPGYDLTALLVGSEGTLGVASQIIVRLMPRPEAVRTLVAAFDSVARCADCVGAIISSGVIPAALEMMDNTIVRAVEAAVHAGYPVDAGAVLLIEVEGLREAADAAAASVEATCRREGALDLRIATDEDERARLWKARKEAAGAIGRLAPNYYVMDGVVPRDSLAEVLTQIDEIGPRHGVRITTLLHAGDGNLHPNVLFDSADQSAIERVRAAGADILKLCLERGGSLTGEHGIGVEKLDLVHLMFSEVDLEIMDRVRGVFDPKHRSNPGKLFPTPGRCIELQGRALLEAHW